MIRHKKLGYVALDVTDMEKSKNYYKEIVGLELVEEVENGPVFFRCSSDHHNLVLYPQKEAGLNRIAFEVENPEQLEIAFEHFTKHGLHPQEIDASEEKVLHQGKTFRFTDPYAGIRFEYYSDIQQMGKEYVPTVTKIARLGHVVFHVKRHDEMVRFMLDVMNFRTSDRIGDAVVFMRCFPNPYHHTFALSRSDENKFHHVNFMVTDIDDIGAARNRLSKNNVPIVFGPGRHATSDSIFLYFLDPDGLTNEYSFGMEEFPEEGPRKARLMEPSPIVLDTWDGDGPDTKRAFKGEIKNHFIYEK